MDQLHDAIRAAENQPSRRPEQDHALALARTIAELPGASHRLIREARDRLVEVFEN